MLDLQEAPTEALSIAMYAGKSDARISNQSSTFVTQVVYLFIPLLIPAFLLSPVSESAL